MFERKNLAFFTGFILSCDCLWLFQILKPLWSCQTVLMELTWETCAQKQVGLDIKLLSSVIISFFSSVHVRHKKLMWTCDCLQVCLPSALTVSTLPRKTSWKLCGRWLIQRSWSPSWTISLYKSSLSFSGICCVLCFKARKTVCFMLVWRNRKTTFSSQLPALTFTQQ